ncbi:reticulocyte binding protein 2b [Plasmodium ovale wallikeri]|uniref:Reticulocyte binding protein 2b n=1 Tax=Plasmodium ovale wallikeri TaxID=864142 RepID=A0A1A9AJG4_PLAOA|nr:reticulocyte binding protein 2b [Plasmodium ovale wallikeri]SBT56237.1 reticulocyte binding protein 2b [Plasmodium ovale wallikeri]
MIKIIREHITEENIKVHERAEKHIKSLEEMKTKLASFGSKKDMNNTTTENISELNKKVNETVAIINQNKDILKDIKRKFSRYVINSNEEKSKKDKFDLKKNKFEAIYNEMKATSEVLNNLENAETTQKTYTRRKQNTKEFYFKEAEKKEKKLNEIKEIKKEIIGFGERILKEQNAIQNELKEIKNVNKLLMLNTSKSVADEISKNTQNSEKLKDEVLKELKKNKRYN